MCLLDEGLVELLVLEHSREAAPGFPADLVGKLTHAGISLLEGRIVRREGWLAELVLDPGASACADYASLLGSAPPGLRAVPEPRLIDYQLSAVGAAREWLQLEVHAWDGLGLLASVMARVVSCGFRIEELLLETEGDCAFHRLILSADAGTPAVQHDPGGTRRDAAGKRLEARAARLERNLAAICA